ncbi:hypothetical protein HRbin27_00053 [bacterium HR27]|nr:hypothetical protein HRbin27_00053 [bacterium HR27]
MADLRKILGGERKVTIEIEGETITVQYVPGRHTTEQLIALEQAEAEGKLAKLAPLYAEFLESVIVDWDLYDGKTKYPHTAAALLKLPLSVLAEIIGAISRDLAGNSGRSPASSNDGS